MARPSKFTLAIAERICERLSDGESLRSICMSEKMPSKATVFRWLRNNEKFRDQYVRAREAQADAIVDEILDIADEDCTKVKTDKHPRADADEDGMVEVVFDAVAVQRNKLRIDARKWLAGKLKPKVYGDRLAEEGGQDISQTLAQLIEKLPG
ncbi:terminase small subunit-like protein [Delftia tsuruhatensis]|uniref:terminase small subunit-like protein n=1 Tax=Delftia tsuruhatensis TaxID=180282 RepID=UPI002B202C49|nr:terminase small subunit protein [Delftia tsuruhatensis]